MEIDIMVQRKGGDLIKFLEIPSEPEPKQVVDHLLFCSQNNEPINPFIYEWLNRFHEDSAIQSLKEKTCLYLRNPSSNEGRYYSPRQVFWEQHPFGRYRFKLGIEFGKYKDLFDQLEVKLQPDVSDAIDVLCEISKDLDDVNDVMEETPEIKEIIVMCWKMISHGIETREVDKKFVARRLSKTKSVLNSKGILATPDTLFFEDRPGLGDKFFSIRENLTTRIEGAWIGMEAAGVRRLSAVIRTELHDCINPVHDTGFRENLTHRRNLIQRVISNYQGKGISGFDLDKVENLDFRKAEEIQIIQEACVFNKIERSTLENVDAVVIDGILYYRSDGSTLTQRGISREIAFILNPSADLLSLGMELKEIIFQSVEDASSTLDNYGYPRLAIHDPKVQEGQTLEEVTEREEVIEGTSKKTGEEGETKKKQSKETTGNDEEQTEEGKKEEEVIEKERNKGSWLFSYVNTDDSASTRELSAEAVEHRNMISQLGVDLVMDYERKNGRNPTDMETIQIHHPGFDIKSLDTHGIPRFIEVKSLSGIWERTNPAKLTKVEYEHAREAGESYWLYIVENLETDNPSMFMIQDPATKVDNYLFDSGWIDIAIRESLS